MDTSGLTVAQEDEESKYKNSADFSAYEWVEAA